MINMEPVLSKPFEVTFFGFVWIWGAHWPQMGSPRDSFLGPFWGKMCTQNLDSKTVTCFWAGGTQACAVYSLRERKEILGDSLRERSTTPCAAFGWRGVFEQASLCTAAPVGGDLCCL